MAIVSWWNDALEALSSEPYFCQARSKTAGKGLVVCEDLFKTYVRAVCGQQVSTIVAEKTAAAVLKYSSVSDDPASVIAGSFPEQLRALGLSAMKAQALVSIARGYVEGSLQSEALALLEDDAVRARLTSIKGVGPWTSDMVLIFGLNRADIWAQKDFGLRKALRQTGLEHEDSSRWAPWRTAATWLLWQSLTESPVQY